uniref:Protein kinase domain-containing protein n=1 Tax=Chlamydomonas euryale TaxID=1486919 RepID=A0A7R9VKR1_9CHLO|mmetsp:Transcript_37758/g.111759  ORF Transcript_37758/g.111759 Transcript_37758/m.111759 type:complete len:497 (+) Transcript_37758:237-1727(+)
MTSTEQPPPLPAQQQPRFETISKLGSGAYGVVFKARDTEADKLVALKQLKKIPTCREELRRLLQEAVILRAVRHPSIVNLHHAYQSPSGRVYLVFEHVDRTIARDLLFRPHGLPTAQVRVIMWQLLQAVKFLHASGILHRDLRPENVLITKSGVVKICDFGLARFMVQDDNTADSCPYAIARWYRAPEVLVESVAPAAASSGGTGYGPGVDVWALGCLMAALSMGQALLPGADCAHQLRLIHRAVGPLPPRQLATIAADARAAADFATPRGRADADDAAAPRLEALLGPDVPGDAVDVIRACLQPDPVQRPCCDELLRMPFFASVGSEDALPEGLQEQMAHATVRAFGRVSGECSPAAVMPGMPPRSEKGRPLSLLSRTLASGAQAGAGPGVDYGADDGAKDVGGRNAEVLPSSTPRAPQTCGGAAAAAAASVAGASRPVGGGHLVAPVSACGRRSALVSIACNLRNAAPSPGVYQPLLLQAVDEASLALGGRWRQ